MCPALSGLSAFCLHAEMFLRGQWEMLVAVCCPGLSCWGAGRSTHVEGAEGLEGGCAGFGVPGSYRNRGVERQMCESIFIHIFMICRLECCDAHYLGMTLKTGVD